MITYQSEPNLNPEEFQQILHTSTLGERRPVEDLPRLTQMLAGANLIWTARDEERLVGVARALSDGVYCTYLSDLAVDVAYQRQGIGKELMRQIKLQTPQATLILLAAPAAIDYYPKVGFRQHEYCYLLNDVKELGD